MVKNILWIVSITLLLLNSCGKKQEPQKTTDAKKSEVSVPTTKTLDVSGTEPQILDPQKIQGAPEMGMLNMTMEGLLRSGKEPGSYIPGVAESYTFDSATNTYKFILRSNAKWNDGSSVTTDDFLFAWRRALDESVVYSFFMTDFVVGADEYSKFSKAEFLKSKKVKKVDDARVEKMTPEELAEYAKVKDEMWSKVGFKVNGNEISIALKIPAPFFPGIVAFSVYYPCKKEFFESRKATNDYGSEVAGLISNGPWMIKEWTHKDYFGIGRNPHYWNSAEIKIDSFYIKVVTDVETRTNLLKTGKIDGAGIQSKDLPDFQDVGNLEQYGLNPLFDMPDYTVFYIEYNFKQKELKNLNIRKAISYAMDRKSFVEKINLGDEPALAFVPSFFPGLNKSFREENGVTLFEDNNKVKAKEHLEKGLKELGLKKLPPLDMLISDGDIAKKITEKFQADWAEIGITVNLVPLPWGEKQTRTVAGKFSINSAGWGPDYPDPMTFLEVFESTNGNNNGKYNNPKYDKLIRSAKKEKDPAKRMQFMYDAEKMIIDDMAFSPEYFRIAHRAYKKYVSGVVFRGIGPATDYYWADIDMAAKVASVKK